MHSVLGPGLEKLEEFTWENKFRVEISLGYE
jgi:hypothetical protein